MKKKKNLFQDLIKEKERHTRKKAESQKPGPKPPVPFSKSHTHFHRKEAISCGNCGHKIIKGSKNQKKKLRPRSDKGTKSGNLKIGVMGMPGHRKRSLKDIFKNKKKAQVVRSGVELGGALISSRAKDPKNLNSGISQNSGRLNSKIRTFRDFITESKPVIGKKDSSRRGQEEKETKKIDGHEKIEMKFNSLKNLQAWAKSGFVSKETKKWNNRNMRKKKGKGKKKILNLMGDLEKVKKDNGMKSQREKIRSSKQSQKEGRNFKNLNSKREGKEAIILNVVKVENRASLHEMNIRDSRRKKNLKSEEEGDKTLEKVYAGKVYNAKPEYKEDDETLMMNKKAQGLSQLMMKRKRIGAKSSPNFDILAEQYKLKNLVFGTYDQLQFNSKGSKSDVKLKKVKSEARYKFGKSKKGEKGVLSDSKVKKLGTTHAEKGSSKKLVQNSSKKNLSSIFSSVKVNKKQSNSRYKISLFDKNKSETGIFDSCNSSPLYSPRTSNNLSNRYSPKGLQFLRSKKYYMKEVKKFFKEKNQKYRTEDYFSNLFSKHFEDNYKALNDLLSTELAESKVQPVQLKSMGHKKMTLLLDLDETLVHCFGDMDHSKPHQRKIIITQPDGTMVKVRFFENFLRQN